MNKTLQKILRELSHNDTTLIPDSHFRVVLETNLMPLIEEKNLSDPFGKVHDFIDELEPYKNTSDLEEKIKDLLKKIDSLWVFLYIEEIGD